MQHVPADVHRRPEHPLLGRREGLWAQACVAIWPRCCWVQLSQEEGQGARRQVLTFQQQGFPSSEEEGWGSRVPGLCPSSQAQLPVGQVAGGSLSVWGEKAGEGSQGPGGSASVSGDGKSLLQCSLCLRGLGGGQRRGLRGGSRPRVPASILLPLEALMAEEQPSPATSRLSNCSELPTARRC